MGREPNGILFLDEAPFLDQVIQNKIEQLGAEKRRELRLQLLLGHARLEGVFVVITGDMARDLGLEFFQVLLVDVDLVVAVDLDQGFHGQERLDQLPKGLLRNVGHDLEVRERDPGVSRGPHQPADHVAGFVLVEVPSASRRLLRRTVCA